MGRQEERRQETHRKLLESASRGFRKSGFSGVGVDAIAKGAGATSGAFYAHMGSKERAFAVAVETGLREVLDAVPTFQAKHGEGWVAAFADYYLGPDHRADLECGCAMTALSPDVVRGGPEIQDLYEKMMTEIAVCIADGLPGRHKSERIEKAWALLHVLIGGLTTARAVATREKAENIAESARKAALLVSR